MTPHLNTLIARWQQQGEGGVMTTAFAVAAIRRAVEQDLESSRAGHGRCCSCGDWSDTKYCAVCMKAEADEKKYTFRLGAEARKTWDEIQRQNARANRVDTVNDHYDAIVMMAWLMRQLLRDLEEQGKQGNPT